MMSSVFIFITILVLESILSIDNAAVLAVVVNKSLTDPKERKKAMTYGIVGAYVFRGLSLFFVSYILYNPMFGVWTKIIGGLYLIKLVYSYFFSHTDQDPNTGWAVSLGKRMGLNIFWQTVVAVEFLDIAFSIDNLLAVVSLTENMTIIVVAVFLGILAMRFVAQKFSVLMEKYPKLEATAFVVILLLGLKLILSGLADLLPALEAVKKLFANHSFDLAFSCLTMVIFFLPLLFPNKNSRHPNK
jgi:YkoY family integral membrane protein